MDTRDETRALIEGIKRMEEDSTSVRGREGCNQLNWNSDGRNELGTKFCYRLGAEPVRQTDHRCDWKWVSWELDEGKPL